MSQVAPNDTNNDTRLSLIASGKTLFWKFGFRKVSVEEICKNAGVSKMTFYRNFSNKNELLEQLLNIENMSNRAQFRKIMDQDIPFKDKIELYMDKQAKDFKSTSNTLLEDIMTSNSTSLKDLLKKNSDQAIQDFLERIIEAQKKGEIRAGLDPQFILYMMNDLRTKFEDPKLLAMYKSKAEMTMQVTNYFFHGILA